MELFAAFARPCWRPDLADWMGMCRQQGWPQAKRKRGAQKEGTALPRDAFLAALHAIQRQLLLLVCLDVADVVDGKVLPAGRP